MVNPDPRGDIPNRTKATYTTASVGIPKLTMQYNCRQILSDGVASSASAVTSYNKYFTLADIPGYTGFTPIFDQYRLSAIRVRIVPNNNAIGLVTNSTTNIVSLYCVLDYDNVSSITTTAGAEYYDNCIQLLSGETMERTFRPRAAVALYGGAFTSYGNVDDMWIDSANTAVQHYGLKIFVPQSTSGQTLLQSWQITYEYFFEFRSLN